MADDISKNHVIWGIVFLSGGRFRGVTQGGWPLTTVRSGRIGGKIRGGPGGQGCREETIGGVIWAVDGFRATW